MTLRRTLIAGGLALGGLVLALLLALVVLWTVQADEILPNTVVAGVDVGGLSAEEAREELRPVVAARVTEPVVLAFQGEEHEVIPENVGFSIDLDATVQRALARGRQGLPQDVVERVRSLRSEEELGFEIELDEGQVRDRVDDLADELDQPEVFGSVEVDEETLEVSATLPQGEVVVRRDETEEALLAALRGEGPREIELPADTTPQPLPTSEVEAVADRVREAISAPLELSASGESLTLTPRDLARLLEVEQVTEDTPGLRLVVTPERVEEVVGEVAAERFGLPPANASYTVSRTPPRRFDDPNTGTYEPVPAEVGIEEGREGARFDATIAAEQLTEVLRSGVHEASLRLETVEPELPTERAEELRPTHAIGTFTTYYQAGQSRVRNIQHLADVIDGTLVLPGEQFSINEISGARTCDKGYVPAGTIVAGELVDTCGGGTSQFGTTMFNAAFFAGVELDQWKAHSWYISRYPMGREATLSYPQLDVKFTNTTEGAILVKTSYTPTSITVTLYGQPIASAVTATHTGRSNPRDYSTEERRTSSLPEGEQRVIQSGQGGFTTQVVRTVELLSGSTERQTIRTVYVPQTRIVEVGTEPPSSEEDEEESRATAA